MRSAKFESQDADLMKYIAEFYASFNKEIASGVPKPSTKLLILSWMELRGIEQTPTNYERISKRYYRLQKKNTNKKNETIMKTKEESYENVKKAFDACDNGKSWSAAMTEYCCNRKYIYIPKELRTHGAIKTMIYLSNVRYNQPDIFNFLISSFADKTDPQKEIFTELSKSVDILETFKTEDIVKELCSRGLDSHDKTLCIKNTSSQDLVNELRHRGYEVSCSRTVVEKL